MDNTTIHHLLGALNDYERSKSLSRMAIQSLLGFAEHIMFTDTINLYSFSLPDVHEQTTFAINKLNSIGCIKDSSDRDLLIRENLSDEYYSEVCEEASGLILEDVIVLGVDGLRQCSEMANKYSRVATQKSPASLKWITKSWDPVEIEEVKESALNEKALGAFSYTICCNKMLYEQLQILRTSIKPEDCEPIAFALDVFIRTAINQTLSKKKGLVYSPAPQRGNVVHTFEGLFRHELSRKIHLVSESNGISSKLLNDIYRRTQIPLPIMAIHFLRTNKIKIHNPTELLTAAIELRETENVIKLREWFNKWEIYFSSTKIHDNNKARAEIYEIAKYLDIKDSSKNLISIFRIEPEVSYEGTTGTYNAKLGIDPVGKLAKVSQQLYNRFSTRNIFYSIYNEIFNDEKLGRDILGMLHCTVVD